MGNIYKILMVVVFTITPIFSFAQVTGGTPCVISGKLCNPIKQDTITGFLQNLLENVLEIGIPIIVLAVIYCGFLFVAARGNPEELTKAKSALLYTLIGAAILLGAWALALLIQSTVISIGS